MATSHRHSTHWALAPLPAIVTERAAWWAAALGAALPVVLGAFLSAGWSWGFDHLQRAPAEWRVIVLALLPLGLFPSVRDAIVRGAEWTGEGLRRRPLGAPLMIGGAAALLYAAFPIATRVYGDSLVFIRYQTPDSLADALRHLAHPGVRFRGSAVLAVHELLARSTGLGLAETYRVVGALCGGAFVFALARLAGRLPGIADWKRAAILWIGVADGANQLFFGHVETYALPRLFTALFLARVVLTLADPETHRPRVRDLGWLLLAMLFHLQAAVVLPTALLWLCWGAAPRHPWLRALTTARAVGLGLALAVAGLALCYLRAGAFAQNYLYSGGHPTPAQVFLPVVTNDPRLPYTLFSLMHAADLFGSLWAIGSGAALFCLLFLWPRLRGDAGRRVLLPAVVLAALHNFLINPSIGFPFDWDLMCVLSPPLLFAAVYAVARADVPAARLLPPLPALGLATLTLFAVNADPESARARVQDMALWLHRSYHGGAHYRLDASFAGHASAEREIADRRRVFTRLRAQSGRGDHDAAMSGNNLGLCYYERGETGRALVIFRQVAAIEPGEVRHDKPLGILECEAGDRAAGIRRLERYVEARPEDARCWLALGDAWGAEGRRDRSRECWDRFLALAPDAPEAARVRGAMAAP